MNVLSISRIFTPKKNSFLNEASGDFSFSILGGKRIEKLSGNILSFFSLHALKEKKICRKTCSFN